MQEAKPFLLADHGIRSVWHEVAFLAIITVGMILTQASLGMSIAPAPHISATLRNPSGSELAASQESWFPAGFSLTVGTFILPAGRWGDRFGCKVLIAGGYAWYGVWSLIAGFSAFSRSYAFFVFCRVMQGIGCAALLPNAVAILGRTYPPGLRKSIAFCIFGGSAPGGFVLGAVFSSLLAEMVWWPWAYWVMGITCAVCTVLAYFIIPASPTNLEIGMDYVGTVLGVSGLVLLNVAWNEGGIVGWAMPYTYIFLIASAILLALFFYHEFHTESPLIPHSLFNREIGFILICIGGGWSTFGIWVYYAWQILLHTRDQSSLQSAGQFVVCAISGPCAALTTALVIGRWPKSFLMIFSMIAFGLGALFYALAPAHQSYWYLTFWGIVVAPFGMDMSFPAATLIMSEYAPLEHQGAGASLISTVQNYFISLSLGIAGTIDAHLNAGGTKPLRGYRSALFFAVGTSGLALMSALALMCEDWQAYRRRLGAANKVQEDAA